MGGRRSADADANMKLPTATAKTLLLVRHGRTFMNEHLSQPGKAWGSAGQRWLGAAGGVW